MNNDIAEWSIPWHELQRNLADGFGVHAAAYAATGRHSKFERTDVRCAPASANSWLIRARTRVLPARSASAG